MENRTEPRGAARSPLMAVIIIGLAILSVEFLIMLLLHDKFDILGSSLSENTLLILDPIVLILFIAPLLYRLFLQPMRFQQVQLHNMNIDLEQRVLERTRELLDTQAKLERDIAERERIEVSLRMHKEMLNEAQQQAHLGSWDLDLVTNRLVWSDEAFRIFEVDPAYLDASYETFLALVHPDDREWVNQAFTTSVAEKSAYDIVHRLLFHDGRVKWMHERCNTFYDSDGHPLRSIGTTHDITEYQKIHEMQRKYNEELQDTNRQLHDAQAHLLQSEKMASIGQLAAGVAHEINNPIGFVYSNLGSLEHYLKDMFEMLDVYERAEVTMPEASRAEVCKARQKKDLAFLRQDAQALMEESKDGITRVKTIVQNLKEFSHAGNSDEWQWADLHRGLDSTLAIVWSEIKYHAKVQKEYGDLPDVECLPSELNQVFMNLLANAAHAIETTGVITIRTGLLGEEVFIQIADTGKGIPPKNLKRIFDPFFTTKPVGKGTGLGLSLSFGIMQKHHGRIEVQSEVGKGTAFTLWLPVTH